MKQRAIVFLILVFAVSSAFAARVPEMPRTQGQDPKNTALIDYQTGVKRLDKCAELHRQLVSAPEADKEKLQKKLTKTLEQAVGDFKRTTMNDPRFAEAYTEMGFALRKLGKYDESLAAYDKALSLKANLSPAIEYRAEAHLALGRIDDARQAYDTLFNGGDRPSAEQLYRAMQRYVAEHKDAPAEFAQWVEQRGALHAQTAGAPIGGEMRTW